MGGIGYVSQLVALLIANVHDVNWMVNHHLVRVFCGEAGVIGHLVHSVGDGLISLLYCEVTNHVRLRPSISNLPFSVLMPPMSVTDNTPPAHDKALFTACYKQVPADFRVDEQMDIEHDGSGEHLYLRISKTGMNTNELVSLLEEAYSVRSQDVGLSGMKDRHAITSQWFSITTPKEVDTFQLVLENSNTEHKHAQIVDSRRHSRKLRRGAHTANAFVITLRDIQPSDNLTAADVIEGVTSRLDSLDKSGFPNYIGPQRFGFGGQNLVRARQWFRQPRKRASRQQRSLWLSAGRSAIFNAVCAGRVNQGSWQTILPGEPAILDGTRSFFDTQGSSGEELAERLQRFDIHPSAPWWGRGASLAQSECAEFENQILANYDDVCAGLDRAGLTQERRAIRAQVYALTHQWIDDTTLELSFSLSPGVFATTLLRELGVCREPEQRQFDTER